MISTLIREPARIAAMRATPEGLRRLRAKAPALIVQCQKHPPMMRRHWDAIQEMADDSVWPVDDLKPYFSLLLSMIDVCLGTAEALHEGLDEAGAAASDLSALDEAVASLRSLRAEVSAVWDWMAAPPPKRPRPARPPKSAAGIARGEYLTIEEAVAQVSGKPPEAP